MIGLKNLVRLPELDSNSTNRDFIHSPSLVLETAGVYFELSLAVVISSVPFYELSSRNPEKKSTLFFVLRREGHCPP